MTLLDRLKMSKFDDILQEHERIYRVYILEELKLAKDSACKFADNENMSAVAQILTTTVKHMQYCNPKFLSKEDKEMLSACANTVSKKLSFYKAGKTFDVFIEELANEITKEWWTIREKRIKLMN